jgi:hypothetical protein
LPSISSTGRSGASRWGLPLRLVGIQAALCALAAWPAERFTGRDGLWEMLLAAALASTAVVASYLGLVLAFPRVKSQQMMIATGGFALRFAILFLLLVLVSKTLAVDLGRIVVWMVGFYMVLVISEAWFMVAGGGSKRRGAAVRDPLLAGRGAREGTGARSQRHSVEGGVKGGAQPGSDRYRPPSR